MLHPVLPSPSNDCRGYAVPICQPGPPVAVHVPPIPLTSCNTPFYQPMTPQEWVAQFQVASQASFFQFTPSEMANVIWAFAKLGAKLPAMWLDNFLMVAQVRVDARPAAQGRAESDSRGCTAGNVKPALALAWTCSACSKGRTTSMTKLHRVVCPVRVMSKHAECRRRCLPARGGPPCAAADICAPPVPAAPTLRSGASPASTPSCCPYLCGAPPCWSTGPAQSGWCLLSSRCGSFNCRPCSAAMNL